MPSTRSRMSVHNPAGTPGCLEDLVCPRHGVAHRARQESHDISVRVGIRSDVHHFEFERVGVDARTDERARSLALRPCTCKRQATPPARFPGIGRWFILWLHRHRYVTASRRYWNGRPL